MLMSHALYGHNLSLMILQMFSAGNMHGIAAPSYSFGQKYKKTFRSFQQN